MPAISRAATAALSIVLSLAALAPASAEDLPGQVGACSQTRINFIGGRLEGDNNFDTGTSVQYDNGGVQISYEREEGVVNSQVGDPVRLCLVSIPTDCPPGDERGRVYAATNLRTGDQWEMPDSQHMCGGA